MIVSSILSVIWFFLLIYLTFLIAQIKKIWRLSNQCTYWKIFSSRRFPYSLLANSSKLIFFVGSSNLFSKDGEGKVVSFWCWFVRHFIALAFCSLWLEKNSTWKNQNCLDDARMSGKFNKKFLEKTDSQKKLFNLARIWELRMKFWHFITYFIFFKSS